MPESSSHESWAMVTTVTSQPVLMNWFAVSRMR